VRVRAGRQAAAMFELVSPAVGSGVRPRVRWGAVALVWTATASLSVIAMLLICVVMNKVLGGFPAPMPLLVMAVIPVTLVLLNAVRQAARPVDHRSSLPATGRGCWLVFFLGLFGTMLVAASMIRIWTTARSTAPPPQSPTMVPATRVPPPP
jgi:hypothetical protein